MNRTVRHRDRIVIPSDTAAGRQVQEQIISLLESEGFSARDVFGVRLALEEALVNAIKHGNQMREDKSVTVEWIVTTDDVTISIEDEGPGFRPEEVPDPTAEENLEKPGGRGIMLMRSFMTSVEYNERGNRVTLVKRKESAGEKATESS
ncbi:MAG: ATP-binding protein [Planctomycetota bacterium]|nr:MAG: ATP-binding protein [Planctomycetota bacterium]